MTRPDFTPEEFDELVTTVLDELPPFFKEKLHNVSVLTADYPTWQELRAVGVRHRDNLLGLYQGVPQTARTSHYGMVLPDKITIYQRPIEKKCYTRDQVKAQVRRTVLHELAHHFGISDDRLRELGAY